VKINANNNMTQPKAFRFKLAPLTISLLFIFPAIAMAGMHFDPAMLSDDGQAVADLSRFEQGDAQLPGSYQVDIYLNGSRIATRAVRFVSREEAAKEVAKGATAARDGKDVHDNTGLVAAISKKEWVEMGVNAAGFPALAALPDSQMVSPGNYIPQAYTAFDFQKMRLDISIPQAALQNRAHDWIAPEQWDEGINAALLSYQFSGSDSRGSYGNSRSHYLNLTSGLNLGAWRLRDNHTWSDYESRYQHQRHWQRLNTYVQRAIIPLRSELTAGDSTTSGDVFDAFSFRGVQLATDDSMYPDTMRGFAPEIKGTANSNAKVTVRQNGNVIYQTYVAAGAFKINDLYPMTSGGDLEVAITEANGFTRVFTVPYSSVPVLQRQGHLRYSLTAGRYRSTSDRYRDPAFAQGTLLWGLPDNFTLYGGIQLADNYRALALGTGLDMGSWGALSADVTKANSTLADGSQHDGQSLRFMYGRSLLATGTTLQLAGYRYSSQGFHTLQETALKNMSGWMNDAQMVDAAGRPIARSWSSYYDIYSSKRERIQANISQRLGDLGSLYLTGSRQTYWHNSATSDSLQAGFSSSVGHVSYSLSYGYSRVSNQPQADKTLFLSLSVPLDSWLPQNGGATHHPIWATYSANRSNGVMSQQAGLSGTALEANNLNWSLSQGYGQRDGGSGDAALGYQGTYGNASLGYGYSQDYRQIRYGVSGGALLHRGGLTRGQPLGATNVLVAVPHAAGIPIENGTGIKTDWRGYAVVPYATNYRENRVALNVGELDDHTDIENAVTRVVPTQGAIVRADFVSHSGIRALMTLTYQGKPLPFGATVSAPGGKNSGLIGDEGQVYLSGLTKSGELEAKWGRGADQQCTVHYQLPESSLHQSITQIQAVCR